MAQRRMFSRQITDTDAFLDMPATAQNLYFHLNMHADDDGFLGNAKTIKRMIGASEDDLKILLAKQFVLIFPDGVAVIRDWHIHNYIQKDRYQPTVYEKDKKKLSLNNTKQYEIQTHKKAVELVDQKDVSELDMPRTNHADISNSEARIIKSKNRKNVTVQDTEPPIPYKEIIDYLNQNTGQKLKSTTKIYRQLIRARWGEGYKLQDFKTVIDNKKREWQGTEFWKYMTPKTLFASSHFDEYLNANKRETKENRSGGFNIDKESQKKFFDQIDDSDLPF